MPNRTSTAEDELAQNYAAAFGGRLQPGDKPALLIVDLVVAYLDSRSPLFCEAAASAVEANLLLIEAARAGSVPVIFTKVSYKPGGADGGVFYRKVPVLSLFDEGSRAGEFPAQLMPGAQDRVVTKQYPSAFFNTDLADILHGDGVDTVVITGFSTSGCVRASALDAMQHGFVPIVVRDACADRHPGPHEANLFDLQAKYAEVVDTPTAIQVLSRVAEHISD